MKLDWQSYADQALRVMRSIATSLERLAYPPMIVDHKTLNFDNQDMCAFEVVERERERKEQAQVFSKCEEINYASDGYSFASKGLMDTIERADKNAIMVFVWEGADNEICNQACLRIRDKSTKRLVYNRLKRIVSELEKDFT